MSTTRRLSFIATAFTVFVTLASPAFAQWTRVSQVPNTNLFSIWSKGDTIVTGADTVVFVSTNAGATWKRSATVAAAATEERVRVHDGRVYAATRGQGIFVSNDLGDSWSSFNQGLVGGFGNSQLDIIDLAVRGDSLFLATEGDGAWVRNLRAGTWGRFGAAFGPAQATNMTAIAAGGSRLLAAGGFNGTVFFRDPGQSDWTLSLLFNDRFAPGLAGLSAFWTGTRWLVGANNGVYASALGQEPWTFVDPGAGSPLFGVAFAQHGNDLFAAFAAFTSLVALSQDDGSTWQPLDTVALPVTGLAVVGNTLYASRFDGLWRRSLDSVTDVPDRGAPPQLAFALAGPQPIADRVRFSFDLPEAGDIAIEVFDVTGRRVGDAIRDTRPAGRGEATWDAGRLAAGVYHARLTTAHARAIARLVRTAGGR